MRELLPSTIAWSRSNWDVCVEQNWPINKMTELNRSTDFPIVYNPNELVHSKNIPLKCPMNDNMAAPHSTHTHTCTALQPYAAYLVLVVPDARVADITDGAHGDARNCTQTDDKSFLVHQPTHTYWVRCLISCRAEAALQMCTAIFGAQMAQSSKRLRAGRFSHRQSTLYLTKRKSNDRLSITIYMQQH